MVFFGTQMSRQTKLTIPKTEAAKYYNELYRRTHECADRFPTRYTSETLPLPIGRDFTSGRLLGRPVFRNNAGNRKWFNQNNIAVSYLS